MKLTSKEANFAVVDEVFAQENFDAIWRWFNNSDFAYRSSGGWQKVWKLTDGQILSGPPYYHAKAPFNCEMDWIHQTILGMARQHFQDIVGVEGKDWYDISLTPYIYPPGTKISWHDDYGYSGACIFYPHKEWSTHWGGELFVAKTPKPEEIPGFQVTDVVDRQYQSTLLNYYGMGVYLSPLPNRMVFTSGKTWHSINRVDTTAGDHCRCSVVAFFHRIPNDKSA